MLIESRTGLELAKRHGQEFAGAVNRILTNALSPVAGRLVCRAKSFDLPLDKLPTRAEWEAQAKLTNYIGNYARIILAPPRSRPKAPHHCSIPRADLDLR